MAVGLFGRDTRRRRIEEQLREELKASREELAQAKQRIRKLEDALHKACAYAEVCEHFPGREALLEEETVVR